MLAPTREKSGTLLSPEEVETICAEMKGAETKRDLLAVVGRGVSFFQVTDLRAMMGNFRRKTEDLEPGYRRRLLPKVEEQVMGAYHDLALTCRGEKNLEDGPVDASLPAYAEMVAEACRARVAAGKEPDLLFLKYLLAAYTMYVRGRPAHPVGTPFPGGLEVYAEGEVYYCPVREKEGDVPFSLCPYCPARQDTGVCSLHRRDEMERIEKLGVIEKSRRHYHG
ncbi:DUF2115 domain-containing protein [Methanofollis formosanus]|uniref:DUF2115 domain-containing protein n=1 Tax=Methanofollis formosanus TaxID=299308 RepID=UPI001C7CDD24|nr:DUF2115 domain-containing protein [Methanofollis formosanus]